LGALYHKIPALPVAVASNHILNAIGLGTMYINVPNGLMCTKILLTDVLHVPGLHMTVVSVSCMLQAGFESHFQDGKCVIRRKGGEVLGSIPVGKGGLFKLWHAYAYTMENWAKLINLPMMHRWLSHISEASIHAIMKSNAITGLCLIDFSIPFSCNSCTAAKSTQKEIHKYWQTPPATAFGNEVYSDLWVSPMESLGGRQYYVTFIDDFSCYLSVNFLRSKLDTLQAYRVYTAWVNTQFSVRITAHS